jgi:hypothetical protein
MGRTLLTLGEPGAGKSVALLKLARALIADAREKVDLSAPTPVVRLPELLRWSWVGMWRGLLKGGALGAGLAILIALISPPQHLARVLKDVVIEIQAGVMKISQKGHVS